MPSFLPSAIISPLRNSASFCLRPSGTPSNTMAWRDAAKLFTMSARRSRTERAASAVVLVKGISPTTRSFSGSTNFSAQTFGTK